MKTIYVSLFTLLVLLTACEKDNGGDDQKTSTSASSLYTVKAPSCLLAYGNAFFGDVYFTYDSQKRLIRQSQASDSIVTTYSYTGNTMYETNTQIMDDGSTDIQNTIHYLNKSGLVDSSVVQSSGQLNYTTIYQYNSQGYLVRTLMRDLSGMVRPVSSFAYMGGNKIADYRINTDWQGQVTDSSLDVSYTYYSNLPGAMEEWEAWTSRTGRGSVNAIKTIQYGTTIETYTITTGSNNLPSKIDMESTFGTYSIELSWKCN